MSTFTVSCYILLLSLSLYAIFYFVRKNKKFYDFKNTEDFLGSIYFFHPFCNDCGGGERVLWFLISVIQTKFSNSFVKIYTCESGSIESIVQKANERFNIHLESSKIQLIKLRGKKFILPQTWPRFTLFGQAFGSIIMAFDAVSKEIPDILIDTTGFQFFGLIMKLAGCNVVSAYVHYPTISSDMISMVETKKATYNNANFITKIPFITELKLVYLSMYAFCYKMAGKSMDIAMVNSRWTANHIDNMWNLKEKPFIIYPPCSPHFFNPNNSNRKPVILSISQFRPEKHHKKQIDIFYSLISNPNFSYPELILTIAGSTRSNDDVKYLNSIEQYAKDLGIKNRVNFVVNAPFKKLKEIMETALIGLHTMKDEHFGIGIVEMMASGLIVIAHASGGPKSDIIVDFHNKSVGFLAKTVDEYTSSINFILASKDIHSLRVNAVSSVHDRFSDEKFNKNIETVVKKLILFLK